MVLLTGFTVALSLFGSEVELKIYKNIQIVFHNFQKIRKKSGKKSIKYLKKKHHPKVEFLTMF